MNLCKIIKTEKEYLDLLNQQRKLPNNNGKRIHFCLFMVYDVMIYQNIRR